MPLQFDPLNLGNEPVGTVTEERSDDTEYGVTEAADIQDVATIRSLGRRGRLQVNADQLRLGSTQPLLVLYELLPLGITPVEPCEP